jgi:hypothetical protein
MRSITWRAGEQIASEKRRNPWTLDGRQRPADSAPPFERERRNPRTFIDAVQSSLLSGILTLPQPVGHPSEPYFSSGIYSWRAANAAMGGRLAV